MILKKNMFFLPAFRFAGEVHYSQLLSTHRNKELFEFCRMHRNIYQINKTIGGADFEIEVIVRDVNHLFQIIDEIKMRFKDVVNDVDYFGFSTFHVLTFIPD